MGRFKFTNYTPRIELEHYANFLLDQIAELMPYFSSVRAESTRTNDGFRFAVSVHALCGTFSADATAQPDARTHHNRMWQKPALEKLMQELKKQIHHWHEKRTGLPAGAA